MSTGAQEAKLIVKSHVVYVVYMVVRRWGLSQASDECVLAPHLIVCISIFSSY